MSGIFDGYREESLLVSCRLCDALVWTLISSAIGVVGFALLYGVMFFGHWFS